MNTENDKRLDNLFKKKLEDPVDEIRYEEKDWDALQQMLGKPRRSKIVYLWPIMGAIAAMLLIFLGWWALRPATGGQNDADKNRVAAQHKKDTIIDKQAVAAQRARDTIIDKNKVLAAGKKADTIMDKAQTIAHSRAQDTIMDRTHALAHKVQRGIQSNPQRLPSQSSSSQNTLFAVRPASARKDTIMDRGIKSQVSSQAVALNQAPVAAAQGGKTDQAAASQPPVKSNAGLAANAPAKPKVKTQMGYRPQYTLSVIAAPDLNGVNSFAQGRVGTNIGLTFAVGLSKKLTVSTGALYSVKPYATNFNNYHTAYQWAVNPENVVADCRMLDIPLNINYQLYHRQQNRFSIGTGLSSYIMLHESYKFDYSGYTNSGPASYTVPSPGKYFFGVANLNATYEHQINSKVGLSIQPYLKVPLSNIGYSQVKLQTTGVAVGLSWNLNSLKKP